MAVATRKNTSFKSNITPAPMPGDNNWLAVSTEGFAQQNAGREPAHLVKELVQNSLDAIDGDPGTIHLSITKDPAGLMVVCIDEGKGITDLDNVRTVFWTSKQDSHLSRGRMGRGFKEMLCLALDASVRSHGKAINFTVKGGKRKVLKAKSDVRKGTDVVMLMPWGKEVIHDLETYFNTFLVPENIEFIVNNIWIKHRSPKHVIEATLTTEAFVDGIWKKPQYKTKVHLVPCKVGEGPQIYEMGIPVCDAEWDRPYHIDVQQRIPMNPNRDAVATGFASKLHKICLPLLITEMDAASLRQEWVGTVAPALPEEVQKDIINKGWGENVVRSVPTMGDRRDFDADAREINREIVKTNHLSSGFREIITKHVPTSAQAMHTFETARMLVAAEQAFTTYEAYKGTDEKAAEQRKLVERVGGREYVQDVMSFAQWFCSKLLQVYEGDMCSGVNIALLLGANNTKFGRPAIATWSPTGILTLGIDTPELWANPLGEFTLEVLIHEAAHSRALHHGDEFHKELEKLAGRAAHVMFKNAEYVAATWPRFLMK